MPMRLRTQVTTKSLFNLFRLRFSGEYSMTQEEQAEAVRMASDYRQSAGTIGKMARLLMKAIDHIREKNDG